MEEVCGVWIIIIALIIHWFYCYISGHFLCFVILSFSLTSLILLSIPLLLYLLCRRVVERDLLFEENHCTKLRTLRACALILQAVLEETEILRTNGKSLRYFIERRSVLYTRPHKVGRNVLITKNYLYSALLKPIVKQSSLGHIKSNLRSKTHSAIKATNNVRRLWIKVFVFF